MPDAEYQPDHDAAGLVNWADACLSIDLAAGMISSKSGLMPTFYVRAQAGPVIDAWLARFKALLPEMKMSRLQSVMGFADLLGGLDLPATLATGRRVYEPGLISKCNEGLLVVPLVTPMASEMASGLGSILDSGMVAATDPSAESNRKLNLGLVIVDQGELGEDFLPNSLRDRLLFQLDLTNVSFGDVSCASHFESPSAIKPALYDVSLLEELCAVSMSLGLTSLRPSQQALKVAALHAGIHGRGTIEKEDLSAAIRLSLINRATHLPTEEQSETIEEEVPEPDEDKNTDSETKSSEDIPSDLDVSSVLANLPPELLSNLKNSLRIKREKRLTGRSGGKSKSYKRGRPVMSVRGSLGHGRKLDLIATLRESAPWQAMRRERSANPGRIQVRKRDFYVKRFIKPSESTTIFLVDASGSTAINRLGEAKGAVELLLGESYSRRDHVALISLRGTESELILPPTRSLARARKTLSGLRGGGGTPLAHGFQKAFLLAQDELRKGRTPNLVLLTDGSANIPLSGPVGRAKAMEDALALARSLASLDIGILVIDVGRSATDQARKIADEMMAKYIPMPFASSKNISDTVRVNQQ